MGTLSPKVLRPNVIRSCISQIFFACPALALFSQAGCCGWKSTIYEVQHAEELPMIYPTLSVWISIKKISTKQNSSVDY